MDRAAPGICPKIIADGVELDQPYMITEYKNLGGLTSSSSSKLAKRLALELHTYYPEVCNGKYGYEVPTFCGATKQANGWYDTWLDCFQAMLGSLLNQLEHGYAGTFDELVVMGRELQKR